jgi:diguanylate cyclase (GGDEF)-like protein/putative nucleotidyltransferase with HDIG domain
MRINKVEEHKQFQIGLWTAGIALFVSVFSWELYQGRWQWLGLLPLVIAICSMDRTLALPLMSKPIHLYHFIFLITGIMLGQPTAALVAVLTLTVSLIKCYSRSKPALTGKLLGSVATLISVWLTGKTYLLIIESALAPALGSLFPAIFVLSHYFLLHSLLTVTCTWLVRPVSFLTEWRKHFLVPTLVFLSAATAGCLLTRFALTFGNEVYLLAVPFSLLVVTIHKTYSSQVTRSSQKVKELSQLQMSIIETLALAIDAKDHSAHGHARRVQAFAVAIAESMGIEGRADLEALRTAALLHDIGKLAIPEYILTKSGKLTDSEFAKMRQHVEIGANILEPIQFPYPVVPIIRYHHERQDGSGYPYGLKGDQIPLGSKILAVADTFEALTAQRSYRPLLTVPEATELIRSESGVSFDPEVVQAFLRVAETMASAVSRQDVHPGNGSRAHLLSDPNLEQQQKVWLRDKGFTEIASTQREIYALHEIFQTIGKSLNLEDTLRIICSNLQSVVPFTTGVVYLKNRNTDAIYPAMIAGEYAEQVNQNWIKPGEGLTGYAIAFGQQVVNRDPALDFQHLNYAERPRRLVNAMVFPLKTKDNILGAITLYSADHESGAFTEDHIRLMETVSERAAISIQNAIAFEYYEENSLTDPLTGLPNSRYMFMVFEQNVEKAERTKEKMAVLVMDLNNFKEINDRFGHKVGDEVLVKVSRILQKEMRKYDTCIRYAGDEFVAFLYNAERETAEKIADRIRQSVKALVLKVRSEEKLRLGISVGLSMYPDDGIELTQLFTVADSQMYNDKFESKAELSRQAHADLKPAVDMSSNIELRRAN